MLHYFLLADYLEYFTEEIAVIVVKNFLHDISLKFIYSFSFWIILFLSFQIPAIILGLILLLLYLQMYFWHMVYM